jgi:phosphoribosylamine-glycine ligase
VGGGGREHALAWKLAQDGAEVLVAPGNAGTAAIAENVPVAATEATLKSIKHLVTPQMMIMDVGSTKVDVVQAARSALRDQIGAPAHQISWQLIGQSQPGH